MENKEDVLLYDIKIRQYYLGNGGKEGYNYDFIVGGKKVGILESLPLKCEIGNVLKINGKFYSISNIYDCELSDEKLECVYYELSYYEFVEDYEIKLFENRF